VEAPVIDAPGVQLDGTGQRAHSLRNSRRETERCSDGLGRAQRVPRLDGPTSLRDHMSLGREVIAGLIGGTIGAGAMSLAYRGLVEIGAGARQEKPSAEQQQEEDATVKVADGVARWLLHRPLPEDTKQLAGNLVHYVFGAGVGALYGGIAAVAPRVTTAGGLPFGFTVWLGAHAITVPALGLAQPPTRRPRSQEGRELVLHLVYGAVTELVRRLARQAP
jgi:putative membrane protein